MKELTLKYVKLENRQGLREVDASVGGWKTGFVSIRGLTMDWPHTRDGSKEAAMVMRQLARDIELQLRKPSTKIKRRNRKH